jgi:hypothetical protein
MRAFTAVRWSLAAVAVGTLGLETAAAATKRLPAGSAIPVRFDTTVSSETSRPEDKVLATVREDVRAGGHVVIPSGSELRGHVLAAREAGRVKGRGYLSLTFSEIVIDGKTYRLPARRISILAPDSHKHDAAVVGGSTGAGAIIGAIADGKGGAAKGALIGAGAGAGAVLVTKGKNVTLPSGARWRVRLAQPLVVD